MKRSASVFAGVIAALATSLFFSDARADSRGDWDKCLSIERLPYAEVISSCTAALASGTNGWAASRAYYLRGNAYFYSGDLEAAVADFSQVIHFYPNNVQGYRARGAAYFGQHKFDLAIADYTRVIEIDPKDSYTDVYDAYAYRGETYAAKDDLDHGIADASKAIEINPQSKLAYRLRGQMYATKGDVELAIADYSRVLQIDAEDGDAYYRRAGVYREKGDVDLAIADYDQAIQLNPKGAAGSYFYRALLHWQNGSLSKSFSDFDQSGRLGPKSAYAALWRELLAKRTEQPSRLAEAATQLDMTKWPAPIVNLFLGASTPEQVLNAADDSDPRRKKAQVCEAKFYSAEFKLQRGSKEEVLPLFEAAAADCPKGYIEGPAANVELKALKASP